VCAPDASKRISGLVFPILMKPTVIREGDMAFLMYPRKILPGFPATYVRIAAGQLRGNWDTVDFG